MNTNAAERMIFIREAAKLLDRQPHTLRTWEYNDMLPAELRPHRNERGWRYWTPAQIEGIKRWLVEKDIRPGSGLPYDRPDEGRVARHRHRMRGPRKAEAQAA